MESLAKHFVVSEEPDLASLALDLSRFYSCRGVEGLGVPCGMWLTPLASAADSGFDVSSPLNCSCLRPWRLSLQFLWTAPSEWNQHMQRTWGSFLLSSPSPGTATREMQVVIWQGAFYALSFNPHNNLLLR